jgi:hypothetical protein
MRLSTVQQKFLRRNATEVLWRFPYCPGELRCGHSFMNGTYREYTCSRNTVELGNTWPSFSQQDGAPHKTCITPQMLGTLTKYGVGRVAGFSGLRTEDQEPVRLTLKPRRVDSANDTHPSSSTQLISQLLQQASAQMPTPIDKTRKAETVFDALQSENVAVPNSSFCPQSCQGGAAWSKTPTPTMSYCSKWTSYSTSHRLTWAACNTIKVRSSFSFGPL